VSESTAVRYGGDRRIDYDFIAALDILASKDDPT